MHAADLTSGDTRQVTDLPAGLTDGAIDPTGRWIWWFDGRGGSERGTWCRQRFAGGMAKDIGLPAAYSTGLVLLRDLAIAGSSSAAGTVIWVVAQDGSADVIHRSTGHIALGAGSADGSLFAISGPGVGEGRDPAAAVLDLAGARLAYPAARREIGLVPGPWSPVPGDQRLLVQRQCDDAARPMIWSPLEGMLRRLDIELGGNLTGRWFPDAASLLICRERAGRGTLHRYVLGTGQVEEIASEPGSIHAADIRPDGAVWYLHSSGARPCRLVAPGIGTVTEPDNAGPTGVSYRDLRVGGVHGFTAEPATTRPHPTIFVLHGGPANHDRDAYCPRVQSWVDAGFAVVLVNYRGSSGYGQRWQDALRDPPGPGLTELEDLVAVRAYLVDGGFADPRRIVVEGGSWGGYLVLLALGLRPGLWQAGIAVVPVADWPACYEDEPEATRVQDRALFGGTPAQRPAYYAERSPLTYADRLRVPVLIIAGRNDPHCPRRQIANYVDRLRRHSKRYVLHEFDGGHGALDVTEQVAQQVLQITFARRALARIGR